MMRTAHHQDHVGTSCLMAICPRMAVILLLLIRQASSWNICLAGGTGPIGQRLVADLLSNSAPDTTVTILTRNSYLAATPSRVSEDYGWMGSAFLKKYEKLTLRDWDGGDLLDIVGQDWLGWQQDVLPKANVMIHLTGGGFGPHRVMACERLVRESLAFHPDLHHITVNPTDELLRVLSPGLFSTKQGRIEKCEAMVMENCRHAKVLRVGAFKLESVCQKIVETVESIRHECDS